MADDRAELDRLRKLKRLKDLEAKAAGQPVSATQQPAPAPKKQPSAARRAEGLVRGVTSGFLGIGDYAAAAGDVVGGKVIRPLVGKEQLPGGLDASLRRVRAQREQLEKETPLPSAVGNIAGAVVPISRVGSVLKTGQPALNTLKTAGVGAAQAGVTEFNLGGDAEEVAGAAATGGVLAPVAGAAARVGGGAVNLIRSGLDKNADEGFRVLARALSRKGSTVSAADLKQRFEDFRNVTGRVPTVTQLLGQRAGETLADITSGSQRAADKLAQSARDQATSLQETLSAGIRRGRAVPAVTKQERLRKVAADRAIGAIESRPIRFDIASVKELVDDRRVYKALPDEEKQVLLELYDSGGDLTVRQVENIRQALRSKGRGKGGGSAKLREFADALIEGASDQVPQYGRFLASYARRSKGIEGQKIGQLVASTKKTNQFTDVVENLPKPGLGGARVGAREALADAASASPEGAARTATALADDAGLAQRLRSLDPAEATRLQRIGKAEKDALESAAATVKAPKGQLRVDDQSRRDAADAALALSGAGSLSFKVSIVDRLRRQFRVPPTAAKKLADALTDPARSQEAIRILERAGVEPTVVMEVARASSRAAARTGGPLAAETLSGDKK